MRTLVSSPFRRLVAVGLLLAALFLLGFAARTVGSLSATGAAESPSALRPLPLVALPLLHTFLAPR